MNPRSPLIEATISGITVGLAEFVTAKIIHKVTEFELREAFLYAFPIAALLGMLVFLMLRRRRKFKENLTSDEPEVRGIGTHSELLGECGDVLGEMGVIACTSRLSQSRYEPAQCMKQARKKLYFLGVLGSKWVIEPHVRAEFRQFLSRIQLEGGEAHFLLINPGGNAFKHLRDQREGAISTESLKHVRALMKEFACFKVRLYDQLPCFRLVFIDDQILALSRYRISRDGYFQSKFGWEAPHIVIRAGTPWSLHDAFELYFRQLWDISRELT